MKNLEFTDDESLWCEDGLLDIGRSCRVSMLVSTYNLEELVPISVKSALSQNYSNFEVVIVDDASTDLSWLKVIETVRHYNGFKGVRVRCLRNKKNLGIVGTFNRLMKESCGELCVWQCGDDVAHLDRVSKVVKCWDDAKACYPDLVCATHLVNWVGELETHDFVGEDAVPRFKVYSGFEVFDRQIPLLGATAIYSRAQYDFFGPVDPKARYEDFSMHIRTKLRGSLLVVEEPLLEYRCVGGASTSFKKTTVAAIRKSVDQYFHSYLQAKNDLLRCRDLIPKTRYEMYVATFDWMSYRYDVLKKMLSDSGRAKFGALKLWLRVVRREKSAVFWAVFLLPHEIADCICWMRCFIGNVIRMIKTNLGRR